MTTYINNTQIVFPDGTGLSSANIPWSNVSGYPTAWSQFTNDLGFLVGTGGVGATQAVVGNCGNIQGYQYVNTYRSGNTLYAQAVFVNCYNCNCNCNCNC